MKGIVVHILATDGDDGKIKFKLIRNRDKTKDEQKDKKQESLQPD